MKGDQANRENNRDNDCRPQQAKQQTPNHAPRLLRSWLSPVPGMLDSVTFCWPRSGNAFQTTPNACGASARRGMAPVNPLWSRHRFSRYVILAPMVQKSGTSGGIRRRFLAATGSGKADHAPVASAADCVRFRVDTAAIRQERPWALLHSQILPQQRVQQVVVVLAGRIVILPQQSILPEPEFLEQAN